MTVWIITTMDGATVATLEATAAEMLECVEEMKHILGVPLAVRLHQSSPMRPAGRVGRGG
jgi:hypothetical protein